jgi:hypothetical protein
MPFIAPAHRARAGAAKWWQVEHLRDLLLVHVLVHAHELRAHDVARPSGSARGEQLAERHHAEQRCSWSST